MLFISRRTSSTQYGVVDTDDNTESIVEFGELSDACCKLGIDIKGVDVFREDAVRGISDIMPYQPKATQTILQIKTLMLNHVDVKTYGDMVTSIMWVQGEITSPVKLRVSDFGTKCADYIILDAEFCNKHVITLILDDKLDFGARSFMVFKPFFAGIEGSGAMFDLREVSSDEKAVMVYNSLYACPKGVNPFNSVIDRPERKIHMQEMYRYRG